MQNNLIRQATSNISKNTLYRDFKLVFRIRIPMDVLGHVRFESLISNWEIPRKSRLLCSEQKIFRRSLAFHFWNHLMVFHIYHILQVSILLDRFSNRCLELALWLVESPIGYSFDFIRWERNQCNTNAKTWLSDLSLDFGNFSFTFWQFASAKNCRHHKNITKTL